MRLPALAALLLLAQPALAECPPDAAVARYAEAMLASRPSPAFTGMTSLEDGFCAQDRLVGILSRTWGPPVGYKVGLTAPPAQRLFGVPHPVRGTLFRDNLLLRSGAEVPASFGAVPQVEADFLLRVRDAGINTAGTDHLALLRHIDAAIPYIELPDLGLSGGFDGPNLLAINVGARLGVLGDAIPLEATAATVERLGAMIVTFSDDTGRQIARVPGSAALGHPLNVVAFIVQDLARQGRALRAGDVLSVAGYSPPIAAEAGRAYTLVYDGLAAAPVSVSVRIR